MLDNYFDFIDRFVQNYGYLTIFVGLMLENTLGLGLVFPGMLILIMGGYYAGAGDLHIALVIVSALTGTIAGDNTSYLMGRYGIIELPFIKRFGAELNRIEENIRRNTERFLVLFHFPVYSRMIVPAFLGILHFNVRKWLVLDGIGALLFTTVFAMAGYIFGRTAKSLDEALDISQYIQWTFLVVFIWWLISVVLAVRDLVRKQDTE